MATFSSLRTRDLSAAHRVASAAMENSKSLSKRFGRYQVLGELGRGAMGVVYKARDPQIDRVVAVKTVSFLGHDKDVENEFRMRFQNEAQAAGRLHHPGIVSVFDVGEDPETADPFIVLEYVAGEALNRVLARERKLPMPRALQLAEEISLALDYAHQQGVTHRDIKPGNIIITDEGHAKIADFGIAKLNLAHFTLPGKLLGTPAYMAPEQLAGEGVDGRSDLFSLGVILYAMVTGHSPFQGDSATTVCFKVANREPVPASALDLNVPRGLDVVIAKAMAKDPRQRYQRGSEFAKDIAELRNQPAPGMTTKTAVRAATRSAEGAAIVPGPAVGLASAWNVIQTRIFRVPLRDLALGMGTVAMLVIVAAQSKLLVFRHQESGGGAAASTAVATDRSAANVPATIDNENPEAPAPIPADPAPSAAAVTHSSPSRSSTARAAKPARHVESETVVPLSTVELAVRHQFKDATLSVFVDGKLVLNRPLHGGAQKRLVVFGGVRGVESETLQVPAGKHEIRFRAETGDHTVNLSKTIAVNLIGGAEKTLQISFDKHNSEMHLDWQ